MKHWVPRFLLVVAILATILVYRPGLNGPFVFDDGVNIVHNPALTIHSLEFQSLKQAAFSVSSGPLMRPISMLSFALNFYAIDHSSGLTPYYFKLTNLVIHLINGVGIFVLTSMILNIYRKRFEPELPVGYIQWVCLAVATGWLLHPLNFTSVLYVVQRMTSLSAFFCICGLVVFLLARTRLNEGKSGILLLLGSLLLFMPLAVLSKENGILLPIFMLVAEVSLFSFHTEEVASRRFLIGFYLVSVLFPVVVALSYIYMNPDWLLSGYKSRPFTLQERLITEARVMWFYIWQSLSPSNIQLGLYHDDIVISRNFLQPISTIFALIGVLGMLVISFFARKKASLITFGILFFLSGHILESTALPLEIAHEHRNYLPIYGILLVVFFYALYPLRHKNNLRLRQISVVLFIALLCYNTFIRAGNWGDSVDLFQAEVTHHPKSALANGEMGTIYSKNFSPDANGVDVNSSPAKEYFRVAADLDKNDTKPLFALILLSNNRGELVEFAWLEELAHRLEFSPYAAISSDKLLSLTKCQLAGDCKIANNDMKSLLMASLRNRTLTGANRAKVLYALSSYIINIEKDYPLALSVMQQMILAAPIDPGYRLVKVNFLIATRRLEEARKELAVLEQLDAFDEYHLEILSIKEIILGLSSREVSR